MGTGLVMKCLVVHPWREAAPGTANLAESCFGIVPTVNIALLGVIDSPGILASRRAFEESGFASVTLGLAESQCWRRAYCQ